MYEYILLCIFLINYQCCLLFRYCSTAGILSGNLMGAYQNLMFYISRFIKRTNNPIRLVAYYSPAVVIIYDVFAARKSCLIFKKIIYI